MVPGALGACFNTEMCRIPNVLFILFHQPIVVEITLERPMRQSFFTMLYLLYAAAGGVLLAYIAAVVWFGTVTIAEERLHLGVGGQTAMALITLFVVARWMKTPTPPQWLTKGRSK